MSAIGGVMSGVMGMVGSLISGSKAREAGRRAAEMHRYQGDLTKRRLETQALDVLRAGHYAADRARHQGISDVGAYRTGYARSGVDVSTGTAAHVQLRGREIAAVEEMLLRDNARRQAVEYRLQAVEESKLAGLKGHYAAASGQAAAMEGYFGAASSLIGGFEQAGFFDID